MKMLVLQAGKAILAALYSLLKLLPTKNNKVVFLSRQSNTTPLDFALLQQELLIQDEGLEMVTICDRIAPGAKSKARFAKDTLRSMYHLATSKVCVLDSYWPAVSIFTHKGNLTVIQIWHALGKIKQSGYQALGKPGGRGEKVSRALHMHRNYDYIIAGAKIWNPCYCASFGCSEDKLVNIGLPRLDYLIYGKEKHSEIIYSRYPELRDKTVLLYAPTFRRTGDADHTVLISRLAEQGYALVLKGHPNQQIEPEQALCCPEFSAMQMLFVADYVITDYSAIALEAAAANVKTFYYLYDLDCYKESTGLNINVVEEMRDCVFFDVESLLKGLENAEQGCYPESVFNRYKEKYLIPDRGHSTKDLANLVMRHMRDN